jgi:hypothetical protein
LCTRINGGKSQKKNDVILIKNHFNVIIRIVGIATGYGLDGLGIESRRGRDFPHQSRPALGPTQPPVQWVAGLSRVKEWPGRDAGPSPPSSAVVMNEYSYTCTPRMGRMFCTEPLCL